MLIKKKSAPNPVMGSVVRTLLVPKTMSAPMNCRVPQRMLAVTLQSEPLMLQNAVLMSYVTRSVGANGTAEDNNVEAVP